MARGTKTYTSARIRNIRTGQVVETYDNTEPVGIFQEGTDSEFPRVYYPPEENSLDCALDPIPVIVNYSMTKAAIPAHVDIVVVPLLNGDNIGNIYGTSTGTFSDTMSGDVMKIFLIHQIAHQPWPDASLAQLIIKKDGVEIFNSGTITDPDLEELTNFEWTLLPDSVYDVIAVSETESEHFQPVFINLINDSALPNPSVAFTFKDSDTEDMMMFIQMSQSPLSGIGMNWPIAGTFGKLLVENPEISLGVMVNTSNIAEGGAFNEDMSVPASDNNTQSSMPKTSYTITLTNLDLG